MGSQSGEQTKRDRSHLLIEDTFEHHLLPKLNLQDDIHTLYVKEQISISQIAQRMNVSRDYVRKILFRKGIPVIHQRRTSDLTGQVPYGWRNRDGKLAPFKREQEVIERIKRARKLGLPLREIARRLTAAGIPTKAGGQWHAKSISQILDRDAIFPLDVIERKSKPKRKQPKE